MLKIRTSVIGKNEYLKFEEHVRSYEEIESDEQLQKAVFRASEYKQISLFEE